MIKELKISNFRCYKNTSVTLRSLSILVGKNNAGKSTLIEALRIAAVITNRYRNLHYKLSPLWTNIDTQTFGVSPSIENLDVSPQNIFHQYGDPPSIIDVLFTNKCRIVAYVGEDAKVFAIIYDSESKEVPNRAKANRVDIPRINILPQISPLLPEEHVIKFDTVRSNLLTKLNSRNFRNQLKYYGTDFGIFRELVETTWKGLAISNLDDENGFVGDKLTLMVRDLGFTAEVGWMGHGLQMWLQTIWFLSRSEKDSTIILDEPDVYMHADLQRRLIRLIKSKYKQIIVATHSVEIMAEVEAENILPVISDKRKLKYAHKLPIVQKIVEDIGSIHNLEIARLFSSKKFIILEGDKDDSKILGIIQTILFPNTFDPIDSIPKTYVEGWGGWQRVIGANKVFKNVEASVKVYCIFDSDYHVKKEIKERLDEAAKFKINLHIWGSKEIENYLLNLDVILRIIRKSKKGKTYTEFDLMDTINGFAEEMKNDLYDDFATEIQNKDRKLVIKTANARARAYIDGLWETDKLNLVPGKRMVKRIASWAKSEFNISMNSYTIARNFKEREIPQEMREILSKIEESIDF